MARSRCVTLHRTAIRTLSRAGRPLGNGGRHGRDDPLLSVTEVFRLHPLNLAVAFDDDGQAFFFVTSQRASSMSCRSSRKIRSMSFCGPVFMWCSVDERRSKHQDRTPWPPQSPRCRDRTLTAPEQSRLRRRTQSPQPRPAIIPALRSFAGAVRSCDDDEARTRNTQLDACPSRSS